MNLRVVFLLITVAVLAAACGTEARMRPSTETGSSASTVPDAVPVAAMTEAGVTPSAAPVPATTPGTATFAVG